MQRVELHRRLQTLFRVAIAVHDDVRDAAIAERPYRFGIGKSSQALEERTVRAEIRCSRSASAASVGSS